MPEDFPLQLMSPKEGSLTGADGVFSITIPFAPFDLDGERVETEAVIEDIRADADEPAALANQTLSLPTNPEPGYADGSIYLSHAHVPFDVNRIAFGAYRGGVLDAEVTGRLLPEYEGLGYRNTDVALRVQLRVVP